MAKAGCRGALEASKPVAGPQTRGPQRYRRPERGREDDDPAKKKAGPGGQPLPAGIPVAPGAAAAEQERLALDQPSRQLYRPQRWQFTKLNRMRGEEAAGCLGGEGGAPVAWIGEECQR